MASKRATRAAAAALVLALALCATYAELWIRDPGNFTFTGLSRADVSFESWLVARHARTLLRAPGQIFETEHCAPEPHSLVFGVPMIAMGVLAIPASLLTRNPIAIYNATLALQSLAAALAMCALVNAWTGRLAAGLVAGLLFAFHPIRMLHIAHPSEWDITWTLLTLFFAERLFAHGRWRDAAGLTLAGMLQVAASFYALLAGALVLTPCAGWLWLRRAERRVRPAQLACAAAGVALAAALVLGPYLEARAQTRIGERAAAELAFATWGSYAPGGTLFFGWVLLALALAGLAVPRRRALILGSDPRPALCIGAALTALIAAGPDTALRLQELGLSGLRFDPYAALAAWVPGLGSIRVVVRLAAGALLVACIFAGIGAAGLLSLAGRRAPAAGAALVLAALLGCFATAWLGGVAPAGRIEALRPSAEQIAFFDELARQGDRGALLELPLGEARTRPELLEAARRILLSGWHQRRTSACFGSFIPERPGLRELVAKLPDPEALQALRQQGFSSLLIHHPAGAASALPQLMRLELAGAANPGALHLLARSEWASAYSLLPAADAR